MKHNPYGRHAWGSNLWCVEVTAGMSSFTINPRQPLTRPFARLGGGWYEYTMHCCYSEASGIREMNEPIFIDDYCQLTSDILKMPHSLMSQEVLGSPRIVGESSEVDPHNQFPPDSVLSALGVCAPPLSGSVTHLLKHSSLMKSTGHILSMPFRFQVLQMVGGKCSVPLGSSSLAPGVLLVKFVKLS